MEKNDLPPLPEWLNEPRPDPEFWGEETDEQQFRRLLIGSVVWAVAAALVIVSLIWMLVP
jgi:hypothetical protein